MTAQNRPLSPHLQVYRPQLTTVLSITHRATGVALAVGTLLLVYWLLAAAGGSDAYLSARNFFGNWFIKLLLFLWSFALFYHLCNGIRHLVWDSGRGLDLPAVYLGGRIVVGAAAALTVLTWLLA
jgi:succinate dehydrogenase / fumarate reductase cytochrome b subunit